MKSGSDFLLAARLCEIADLEQLARTADLVAAIAGFIHALQRERGSSNIYLSSLGARFGAERIEQVAQCVASERAMRDQLDMLDTESTHARNGARLFSGVAVVLHGLERLPALRERIGRQSLTAAEATAAFVKLVSGLLSVVFEAADTATDPEVSRALVAMFHFMQGKEFAGQERALGGRVFAAGHVDRAGQQHWRHLVESQQGCFQVFADFSPADVVRAELASREAAVTNEIERMRRRGCTLGGDLDPRLADDWYHWCTVRIDAMRAIEDLLARRLAQLCRARIEQARAELRDQRATLDALSRPAAGATPQPAFGPHLERSLFAMVQEQSRRLQAMGDELEAVRATLNERKVVERAKGLLMAHQQLGEDDAYKALRQMAMNQGKRLVDVAHAVLSLADVLPAARR
jgi:hypothetical protein